MTQAPDTLPYEPTRVITLIALFRSVTRLMVEELVARLHAAGYTDITPAQHLVFENTDAQGTRLTILGQRAGITRQSVTELASALERNGYVELRPDPSDRRARLVVLTDAGKALVRHAIAEIAAIQIAWEKSFECAGLDGDLREVLTNAVAQHAALNPAIATIRKMT